MVVHGRVVDEGGGAVGAAAVYIVNAPVSVPDVALLTDEHGRFTLSIPVPGRYTLGARSETAGVGHADVALAAGESIDVELQLRVTTEAPRDLDLDR